MIRERIVSAWEKTERVYIPNPAGGPSYVQEIPGGPGEKAELGGISTGR